MQPSEDDKESTHNHADDDAILSEIVAAASDLMTSNIYIKNAPAQHQKAGVDHQTRADLHPVPSLPDAILLSNTGY